MEHVYRALDELVDENDASISNSHALLDLFELLHDELNRLRTRNVFADADEKKHVDTATALRSVLENVSREILVGIQKMFDALSQYAAIETKPIFTRLERKFRARADFPVLVKRHIRQHSATDDEPYTSLVPCISPVTAQRDSEHQVVIRKHYEWLVWKLSAHNLAIEMYQKEAITKKDVDAIQKQRNTPCKASETLLNILLKQPFKIYEVFKAALVKTNQDDVYLTLAGIGTFYAIILVHLSRGHTSLRRDVRIL